MNRQVGVVMWLVAVAAAEVFAFIVVWHVFVRTGRGQLLDSIPLSGNSIGHARVYDRAELVLRTISTVSLVAATVAIGFIALARRRVALAFGAVLLVAGANVTTQVVKQMIYRPDFGVDPHRTAAGNTLPSGHTTVAASVAVAFLLVLPARLRGLGGVLGAIAAAGVGVGTLATGAHRPSDVIAAVLVVGGWACAAALFIMLAQREDGDVREAEPHDLAVVTLVVAGLMLLAGAGLGLELTNRALGTASLLGRGHQFAAYAGAAMGIAGVTALMLAAVLASAHRVVAEPDRTY
jgi:membrane-associated phospholipid phosphatase